MTKNKYEGYLRVAAVSPKLRLADCDYNTEQIIAAAREAADRGARLVVFPELCITAYTCGDLFHNRALLDAAERSLWRIAEASRSIPAAMVVGLPRVINGTLYNVAFIVADGETIGPWTKTYIPNYNEFYEKRWWPRGETTPLLAKIDGVKVGVEICEDLWAPIPPSSRAALAGAEVIVNLSASDDVIGKYDYLRSLISGQSARTISGYIYAGAGWGESSTDLVYDGKCIIAENGSILAANPRWQWDTQMVITDIDILALRRDRMHLTPFSDCANREVDTPYEVAYVHLPEPEQTPDHILHPIARTPFVPATDEHIDQRCSEIINIQCSGLAKRLTATGCKSLTIGISGGLDSTLALLVAVRTFDKLGLDRKGLIGVTMPGFGTTGRTYTNAMTMMRTLGITIRKVPIADAVNLHFRDIGHDPAVQDVTYENSQARERTQILMDIANQTCGMVLGTGDLSELALGWATYNGDHMSMYGVNAGVPKTLVRYLVRWFATRSTDAAERQALEDVIDTPISPELIPANPDGEIKQKTEDLVGPYELHDFFLYYTLRFGFSPRRIFAMACQAFEGGYTPEVIKEWMRTFFHRFFSQQFKRSCLPDGPKVGSVCLSPRGDWRMPSDASSAVWMNEIDEL